MKLCSARWNRLVLRCGLTVCGILALLAAPRRSLAQCDPSETAKLTASDGATDDSLGYSVAVDGDTAIVGAYVEDHDGSGDAGAAYVFVRSGGVWTPQAKLVPADSASDDLFGISVAISGDTAVIGASGDDHAGGAAAGSAYVFTRMGGVWSQQAKLTASDAAANDQFGISVALDDDTAVVGSRLDDHAVGIDAGSAYVFIRCGISWNQQQKLTAADGVANDLLGISVAISGETAIVGAQNNDGAGSDAGAAYVFLRAGTFWSQQAKLTAPGAAALDHFGRSVALSGNTALVGATGANAAYAFIRTGFVWTYQATLLPADLAASDGYAVSVGLSGDTAVVGAWQDDHAGGTNAGSASVFTRSGSIWTEFDKLTASDAASGDVFGWSVAVAGVTAVVGAYSDDNAGGANAGAAYVFDLTCDSDGDGVPDADDVCPGTPPSLPVDCTGRPLRDCNGDCLFNASDIGCIIAEMLG